MKLWKWLLVAVVVAPIVALWLSVTSMTIWLLLHGQTAHGNTELADVAFFSVLGAIVFGAVTFLTFAFREMP